MLGTNNLPPITPRPQIPTPAPPAPQPNQQPQNIFNNLDSRICFILSNIFPSYSLNQIAALASNRTVKN